MLKIVVRSHLHANRTDCRETGKIKPVIDRRYSLNEVPEAIRYVGEGHARGKVVITVHPSGEPAAP